MKLAVFSHKLCWPAHASPTGFATDGGFPFHMRALSELFDETVVVVPCAREGDRPGQVALTGHRLVIRPLTVPPGFGLTRKLLLPWWAVRNGGTLLRELFRADVVHAPIPGDVGTLGMLGAWLLRKRLYVRHCGNWFVQVTAAEHFWRWFLERAAGKRTAVMTTGGSEAPPSSRNPNVQWIFSTSLTESELAQYGSPPRPHPGTAPRLVIACRQEHPKGTGVVIESLPLIADRYPGATLDVAGEGPALEQFRVLASGLGVSDRVRFHGQLGHADVMQLFQSSHLLCFPTTASEGFPKVVLEALACGLPAITTRVSVLPRLLESGCGILLDAATPEAVAAAVEECLDGNGSYARMSGQARATAAGFSLERWGGLIGERLSALWGPLRSGPAPTGSRGRP